MATVNEILVANQGTLIVNDTNEAVVNHDAIFVLEDTIFNTIKIAGIDVKSQLIKNPAIAVKAGAMIRATGGRSFSAVDLVSGSVILIL